MALSWTEIESGIYGNPKLSMDVRMIAFKQTRMYELVTPSEDFYLGRNSGDTIGFRIVGRISQLADSPLGEFQKIPLTKPPEFESTAVVYRRGIGVPWTGVREDLDRLDVESLVVQSLKENSARTHNKVIYDAAVAGRSYTYVATGAATADIRNDGTVASNAAAPYTAWHARRISLYLQKVNMPYADGKAYHAVVSPTMHMNLLEDSSNVTGFVDIKRYSDGGADGLLEGEVGTYMGVRYIVDNDVMPDAVGTGQAFGTGFFAGLDALREIPVYPMHLLANMNLGGDFGQQKAVAWLSMISYKSVWVHSAHGQGSLLHYTSLT
jgi:N4-gp56 family major capsid protein